MRKKVTKTARTKTGQETIVKTKTPAACALRAAGATTDAATAAAMNAANYAATAAAGQAGAAVRRGARSGVNVSCSFLRGLVAASLFRNRGASLA